MTYTDTERRYLQRQHAGRLATIDGEGAPQVNPVAFVVEEEGSILVGGPDIAATRKWRNVVRDPRVALVVDDFAPPEEVLGRPGRGVEIRGVAELIDHDPIIAGFTRDTIRIRPSRVIGWNLDAAGANARSV